MPKGPLRAAGIVLAGIMLLAGTVFAEEVRIAVIDVQTIMDKSQAGASAKKKLEGRYEELKKQIDIKQDEIRKSKEDLDKQKILLGKEKVKEREDAIAGRIAELQQLVQKAEREMQTRQGDVTREVLKLIEVQVDKIVAEEKIDLLLEKSAGVIHSSPSLDITEKVLEMVNRENKGASGGK
jgi:outer membrane protein